jgi:predicted glutamine amidotransferase
MVAIIPYNSSKVNSEFVRSFKSLARFGMIPPGSMAGHSNDWGILSWINGSPIYLGREPTDAWRDKKYDRACDWIDELGLKSPLLVHLRKASVGLKIKINTHPFVIQN